MEWMDCMIRVPQHTLSYVEQLDYSMWLMRTVFGDQLQTVCWENIYRSNAIRSEVIWSQSRIYIRYVTDASSHLGQIAPLSDWASILPATILHMSVDEATERVRNVYGYFWYWSYITCTFYSAYREEFIKKLNTIDPTLAQVFTQLRYSTVISMHHMLAIMFWGYVFQHIDEDHIYYGDILRFLNSYWEISADVLARFNTHYAQYHLPSLFLHTLEQQGNSLSNEHIIVDAERLNALFAGRHWGTIGQWNSYVSEFNVFAPDTRRHQCITLSATPSSALFQRRRGRKQSRRHDITTRQLRL